MTLRDLERTRGKEVFFRPSLTWWQDTRKICYCSSLRMKDDRSEPRRRTYINETLRIIIREGKNRLRYIYVYIHMHDFQRKERRIFQWND